MIYKRTRAEIESIIEALEELLEYPPETQQLLTLKNGLSVTIPITENGMVEGLGVVLIEEPRDRLNLVG